MPINNNENEYDYLYEIGDFGLEVEISDVNRFSNQFTNELHNLLPGYKRAHDASCETPMYSLLGVPTITSSDEETGKLCLFMNENTLGGEIVSPIIPSSDCWAENVYKLTDLLFRYGETNVSSRDSMHIHVNVGKAVGLETIKNILHLTSAYESILYRLGGLGRENRGEQNSYIYQRPYLGNSPPVVTQNGAHKYPIAVFEDLMDAETKSEFFDRLGDTTYYAARRMRYVTQRYFGVNFYSIPIYGTVEFRTMNKTLNPDWIIAWVALCRAIIKKAVYGIRASVDNTYRPLFANREIPLTEFTSVLDSLPLDTETIKVLRDIWKESPTPKYDNKWRYSHLREPTYFHTGRYMPKFLECSVYKPVFVDFRHIKLTPIKNFKMSSIKDYQYSDEKVIKEKVPDLEWRDTFEQALNDRLYWSFQQLPYKAVCSMHFGDNFYFTLRRGDEYVDFTIDDFENEVTYSRRFNLNHEDYLHDENVLNTERLISSLYDEVLEDYEFDVIRHRDEDEE